ncbi:MAG: DUF664 domain-containing protein [Armatimonadetes bacterium]|nr:DUF664 domain-containing protein [Armatimonadota bacterium]
MNDFHATYGLVRGRLIDAVKDLNDEQLKWRLHPASPSISEMVLHVCGVEMSFACQLLGQDSESEFDKRIRACARDGIVNDSPFPFSENEQGVALMNRVLERGLEMVGPLIEEASDAVRETQIESALGPMIDGNGAFARIAYHPGYHTGQIWTYRYHPDFPQ